MSEGEMYRDFEPPGFGPPLEAAKVALVFFLLYLLERL